MYIPEAFALFFNYYMSVPWLSHDHFWGTVKGTASLTAFIFITSFWQEGHQKDKITKYLVRFEPATFQLKCNISTHWATFPNAVSVPPISSIFRPYEIPSETLNCSQNTACRIKSIKLNVSYHKYWSWTFLDDGFNNFWENTQMSPMPSKHRFYGELKTFAHHEEKETETLES